MIVTDTMTRSEEGSQHTMLSHLVVAVPDASIQNMLQDVLDWYGYRVTCIPIDPHHPLIWIVEAVRVQPEALIVDVDLFRYRSVQETILDVLHVWEQLRPAVMSCGREELSCVQPPIWVWLSRRPVEGSEALRMPFRLAQLDAALCGCGSQGASISPSLQQK